MMQSNIPFKTVSSQKGLWLVLSGIVFAIPFIIIALGAIITLERQISVTRDEQRGIKYHKALVNVMTEIQTLRGMQYIHHHGDLFSSEDIKRQEKALFGKLDKMDKINNELGKHLDIQDKWQDFSIHRRYKLEAHSGI